MAEDDSKTPEVETTKSTAQLDMEARAEQTDPPKYGETVAPTESDFFEKDGFVGVSPEYQNYANKTDKPMQAEDGVLKDAEESYLDSYGDGTADEAVKKEYGEVTPHNPMKASDEAKSDSDETTDVGSDDEDEEKEQEQTPQGSGAPFAQGGPAQP